MQRFYKGRTNNHLTWVMVDATDFATPESALSAATKIKVYGKLRGATGVNFVSSGTGSLTNDIQHVGASVLGLYTIALAKADLSDASAAWYDQYVISLSATGAAFQALVVEGVIDESAISALISDIQSAVLLAQSMASDAASAAAQGNSRILLVQSRLSDLDSRLVSDLSDVLSGIVALSGLVSDVHSAANVGNSRILLVQSRLSDLDSRFVSDLSDVLSAVNVGNSRLVLLASSVSDVHSAVGAITASVSASDISDIASAVRAALVSDLSDILSAAVQANSRVLVAQSYLSDIRSHVSDLQSDFQSRVPKLVATNSQLSDLASDLKSAVGGITVTIGASDVSDIASAVLAGLTGVVTASDISDIASAVNAILASRLSDILSAAVQVNSRVLVVQSQASDTYSLLTSRVPKEAAARSQLSDLASDLRSVLILQASAVSDIYSMVSDLQSDFGSRVPKRVATDSQLSDLASDLRSVVVLVQSLASDAHSAAAQASSRILVAQSSVSDVYSLLSDLQSDFGSRVPKRVATDSQVSALTSDVLSALAAGVPLDASTVSDLRSAIAATELDASDLSNIASAVWDEPTTGHATAGTYGDKFGAHLKGVLKVVVGVGSSTTSVVLNATTGIDGAAPSAVDDFYNGRVLVFTSGALAGQATSISDYTGATVTLTVVALTGAPASGVTAVLV